MSTDDLDIRHGSVVAVDTQTVRDASSRVRSIARSLDAVILRLRLAESLVRDPVAGTGRACAGAALALADGCARTRARVAQAVRDVDDLADRLDRAAARYEAAELSAWMGVPGIDQTALLERLDTALAGAGLGFGADRARGLRQLDELMMRREMANREVFFAEVAGWSERFGRAPFKNPIVDIEAIASAPGALYSVGMGVLPLLLLPGRSGASGTRDRGDDVRLTGGERSEATAPADLAAAVARVPHGGSERVRLERYDFADGHTEWLVYVTGTQVDGAATEPFDGLSNVQLATGHASASLQTVRDAMRAAGVGGDDTLHFVGYSQGSMVTADLAAEHSGQTATHIGFGMPQTPVLAPGTLSIELSHHDDPVGALSAPDAPAGTGSDQSLLISRTATPDAIERRGFDAHDQGQYVETARRAENSGDPRMQAPQALFDHLAEATSVTAVGYGAVRSMPGAPLPTPDGPRTGSPSPAISGGGRQAVR